MKKRIDTIPATAMDAMLQHHWPGNVRELENFIERSVILSRETELQPPLPELSSSSVATSAKNLLTVKKLSGNTSCVPSRKHVGSSADPRAPPFDSA